jgi:hypothetical protein
MAVPAHPPPGYTRRPPEQTVLYGALRKHAETFLADVETDPASSGLPMFVRGEVGWSVLLWRVFSTNPVLCPPCEKPMVLRAVVRLLATSRVLASLSLSARGPLAAGEEEAEA